MNFSLKLSLKIFMDFLLDTSTNQIILYLLHFVWAFFDSFIFSSFFIFWEIFFLSGWYLSVDILDFFGVYLILVFWALFWDNVSYFLWKKYGRKIFLRNGKIFNEKKLEKWEKLLEKYWFKIIFFSRFIWPIYWLIPTIAWTFNFSYKKFLFFNFFWVLVWVLQFMAYGYFFGLWLSYFWTSIFINLFLFSLAIYLLFLFSIKLKLFLKWKKYFSIFILFFRYFFIYSLSFFSILAYYYFFLYPVDAKFYDNKNIIYDIKSYLNDFDKKIYSDKVIQTNSNPINIIIVSDKNINEIMFWIWWKENLSFSSWKINFSKFVKLLLDKEPPISDYYHNWFNQNHQFQDFSNSNLKRNHVRFWEIWKNEFWDNVYIWSVSKDKNFTIMINNWLPIVWHSIYENIDFTRNMFKDILMEKFPESKIEFINFQKIYEKNYFTDWQIFVFYIKS